MYEFNYNVVMGGAIVAEGMQLEYAVILVDALFKKYYSDACLSVTIEREPKEYANKYERPDPFDDNY